MILTTAQIFVARLNLLHNFQEELSENTVAVALENYHLMMLWVKEQFELELVERSRSNQQRAPSELGNSAVKLTEHLSRNACESFHH